MEKMICTENIVASIKKEIEEEKIPVCKQFLYVHYYVKRMEVYRKQKELVIVGAGSYGMMLYRMLKREKMETKVKCFCDNNVSKQHTVFQGLSVLSVEEAYEKYGEAMYVITPRFYENEILKQLWKLGIDMEKISIFITAYGGAETL